MRLLFLCVLLRSGLGFNNDATELFSRGGAGSSSSSGPDQEELQGNTSLLNRARTGGRALRGGGGGGGGGGGAHGRSDKGQIGCRELRSTKYISDGRCTSIKPIKELVCAGECLPAQLLPNWIGSAPGSRLWGRKSGAGGGGGGGRDWRCVNDKTRTQRIQLQCQDGSSRAYKITVVTSCKCKRYSRRHNQSEGGFQEEELKPPPPPPHFLHKHQGKSRRTPTKKRLTDNWHEP